MTIIQEAKQHNNYIVEIRQERFDDLDTYIVCVIEEDGDVGYVKRKSARYHSLEAARRTYRRYIGEVMR